MIVKYKSIDKEIEVLKSKGLKFKNEDLAREIILKENYYFLTKGYEEIFLNLKNKNNDYQEETYFEELYALYNFDRELKNLLLDYINLVETKLKSFIAYEYQEKYGEENLLESKNLNDDFKSVSKLEILKKQMDENIKKALRYDFNLQESLKKNGYLKPLIMIKYFMFGNVIALFSILKPSDREKVAMHFMENDYKVERQLKMLNSVRNICAHGDILFNFRYRKDNLYSVIVILKQMLDNKEFYSMFIRVENLLVCIRDEIDNLSYHNLLEMMGFRDDYKLLIRDKKGEFVMNYEPKPIDTKDIVLGDDILNLAEELAKNTHDIWATGRISEGWKYGTVRDDKFKTTPCLVPYEELPNSEKEYDRNTAIETLKLIQKLGFKIEKDDK